jgi:tetratricopeptide (TPR) repeat protein
MKLLDGAPADLKQTAEWQLLRVYLLAAQGKVDDARQQAEAGHRQHPKALPFWVALADFDALAKKPDEGLKRLDAAKEALGDRAELRLARLRHLRAAGRKKDEAELLRASVPEGERAAWLRGLAGFHLERGEVAAARQALDQLVAQSLHDLPSLALLFDLTLPTGDDARLRELVKVIHNLEGEKGTLWRYGEAARLLAQPGGGGAEPARALLAAAREHRPSWPRLFVLQGLIEERAGNVPGAIEQYQSAVNLGEGRPEVFRRLVQLYNRQRHYKEAQGVIDQLRRLAPRTAGLERLAAETVLFGREDPKQALRLAKAAVSSDSRDYRDHLWLGQVLWALEQRPEAEAALRKAVALGGAAAEPRVTLVRFLAEGGKGKEAAAELEKARRALPAEVRPLALAACHEALGQRAEAEKEYGKALKARPNDPVVLQAVALFHLRGGDLKQAEPVLRELMKGGEAAGPAVAWARRALALALAATGDYRRSQEGLALVEQNLSGRAPTLEDRRAKALILAQQPGGRREAIGLLKGAFREVPPSAPEKFLLARLYAVERKWDEALGGMRDLVNGKDGNHPVYLDYYIRLLLYREQPRLARSSLGRLKKLEPGTLRTIALEARVLQAEKKGAKAVDLLKQFAADKEKDANVQLAVGRLLDELRHPAAAEPYYRAYAAREKELPRTVLPLVGHLARRNRLTEALDLCQRVRDRVPADILASVSVGALRAGQPEAKHLKRVEGWLLAAEKKAPGVTVELALADLRDLQGRPAEAERAYRAVLERDPNNVVALNNLAVLLALHAKKGPEALVLIEKALQVAGPHPSLLDSRGIVRLQMGDGRKAAQDLEQALAAAPGAASYARLARAYWLANDPAAARGAWRKAHDAGLKMTDLHPLERPTYEELKRDLEAE